MNKISFIFLAVLLLFLQLPLAAQQADTLKNRRWYFGAEAGAQLFMGRNDSKMAFGSRLAPSFDLIIGRKLSNVVALDLNFSNSQFKGVASPLTTDAHFLTDKRYTGDNPDEALVMQKGYMMNLYLRCLVDLTNWWGGVDAQRNSSISVYAGGGLAQGYGNNGNATSPSINAGFVYGYHFNEALAIDVTLKGALVSRDFEGEHCEEHAFHGVAGINIGIKYAF